jgi:HrpA-like RNA helicase
LPGEREIREATDHLRKHLSHQPALRNAEVLPLFARLSQAEQDRIFQDHSGRRIVLSTNVAETSLTVPGIRYVIDAGTARVKRYSFRQKVEQLMVEPISQAAANQRAGRCGRVADGICIRLYDEAGFNGRPRFTDPEILRSSLAGVILRMKALRLGAVEDFAFIEPPQRARHHRRLPAAGRTGRGGRGQRTHAIGRTLSRLPLDPRVGRMILEAQQRGALDEVMVIASALSVQDVRDRPLDKQTQADQAHKKVRRRKERVHRHAQALEVAGRQQGRPRQRPQAQPPPVRKPAARELHQRAPRARVARHPHPAAHRGGRAQVEAQHPPASATSSCTCPCWRACWATSAARTRPRTGTWGRAASSFTATRART